MEMIAVNKIYNLKKSMRANCLQIIRPIVLVADQIAVLECLRNGYVSTEDEWGKFLEVEGGVIQY